MRNAIRERLPLHPNDRLRPDPYRLRVDCLVRRCLDLTTENLAQLPQRELADEFTCLEGWTVPKVKWAGARLETVLSLGEPLPEAQYVQASAGDFSFPLSLAEASLALLAILLGDDIVPVEHGGPVRLVVPGGQCFMQMKWLNHLELCREPGANTAKIIALGRLHSI